DVYPGTAPNQPSSLLIVIVHLSDNCCNPALWDQYSHASPVSLYPHWSGEPGGGAVSLMSDDMWPGGCGFRRGRREKRVDASHARNGRTVTMAEAAGVCGAEVIQAE
ncbi:MAG: hypothetical protein ACP5HZ_12935, partial [Ferrimicrobium sp.]